jgi:hypothetical protein
MQEAVKIIDFGRLPLTVLCQDIQAVRVSLLLHSEISDKDLKRLGRQKVVCRSLQNSDPQLYRLFLIINEWLVLLSYFSNISDKLNRLNTSSRSKCNAFYSSEKLSWFIKRSHLLKTSVKVTAQKCLSS